MGEDVRRFRLVVALDGSEYSDAVLEYALDQAARHEAPDVNVVTVVERRGGEPATHAANRRLHEIVGPALETFTDASNQGWRVRLHVRAGRAAEEIQALADELDADLIVVGRFGARPHWRRSASIADEVLHLASRPVLVVQIPESAGIEPGEQCVDCARVRRESDGDHWFCQTHSASPEARLNVVTVLLPHEGWGLGGGLIA